MKRMTWLAAAAAAAFVTAVAASRVAAQDTPPSGGDKPAYVGDKTCMTCHFKEHKSWKKTTMGKAMKSLAPTAEADNKELFDKKKAAGLDPAKDYTTDEKCVKCHTTGWGTETGYPKDPKADDAAGKRAAMFGNVGCEACHGPGSLYVKHKTEALEKDKAAKFTFDGLSKLGLVAPDAKMCQTCHNADSPIKEGTIQFDDAKAFEEAKAKTHDKPAKK